MEASVQTDKPKISEKRLEALRRGREEHHRRAREYKRLMSEVVIKKEPEAPKKEDVKEVTVSQSGEPALLKPVVIEKVINFL